MDSEKLALRRISTARRSSVGGELDAERERSSLATASFRVYYSLRPGAVPFLWESTPGTPKSAGAKAAVSPVEMAVGIGGAELPPISPPPSYHSSQLKKGRRRRRRCLARPPPCTAGCVLTALLAALGISRRARRRPSRLAPLS